MKKINFLICITSIAILFSCHSSDSIDDRQFPSASMHAIRDSTEPDIIDLCAKVADFMKLKMYDSALKECDKSISRLNRILGRYPERMEIYASDISFLSSIKMNIYDSLYDPNNALKAAFEALKWSKKDSIGSGFQYTDESYIAIESGNLARLQADPIEKQKLLKQAFYYSSLARKHEKSIKFLDSTKIDTNLINANFNTIDSSIHSELKNIGR